MNLEVQKLLEINEAFQKYPVPQNQPKHRETLPAEVNQNYKQNALEILKHNIGKDLSKICIPVWYNEPISHV